MNLRERFLAAMSFEPVDRLPYWDLDYWGETFRNWAQQGAPLEAARIPPADADEQDRGRFAYPSSLTLYEELPLRSDVDPATLPLDPQILRIPLNSFVCPLFEYRVLEVEGDTIVSQDPRGHIRRDKRGLASISNIVKPLVAGWEDWDQVKAERLALSMDGRLPADWPRIRDALRQRDRPLAVGGHSAMYGFYHAARYLMGPEALLYAFYDHPDLVHDIFSHLTELYLYLFDRVLSEVPADLAFSCEDIGFKTGPFISPAFFCEFIAPCYRRVNAMLRDHGVRIILIDTDGNNWKLIPDFIHTGVTGIVPLEIAAGMDPAALRAAFPRLQMMGGVDKAQVAAGHQAIDREIERISGVVRGGGYVPAMDHGVPPDVSWDEYRYFRARVAELGCDHEG